MTYQSAQRKFTECTQKSTADQRTSTTVGPRELTTQKAPPAADQTHMYIIYHDRRLDMKFIIRNIQSKQTATKYIFLTHTKK